MNVLGIALIVIGIVAVVYIVADYKRGQELTPDSRLTPNAPPVQTPNLEPTDTH